MRRFTALMRKEWRDARLLTLGAAAVALGGSIAANEIWLEYDQGTFTATYLIPALVALYALSIASDLVAGDASTGRVETLALLPTRGLTVWAAKATFLLAAGLVFLLWAVAVQLGLFVLAGERGAIDQMILAADACGLHLALALPLAGTTLFFSTLIQRGFAAVLASLVVCGGIGYGLVSLPWKIWEVDVEPWHAVVLAALVGAVFAASSAVAYVAGRIHLGGRLRRAVLGIACALLLLMLPVGAGARALDAWLTLEPGDADAVLHSMMPSPDGEHLALSVGKQGQKRDRCWLLRVEDGRLLPVAEFSASPLSWDDEGLLRVRIRRPLPTHLLRDSRPRRPYETLDQWLRPADVAPQRTRSPEQLGVRDHLTHGWAACRTRCWAACRTRCVKGRWSTAVFWPEKEIEEELEGVVLITRRPGMVLLLPRRGETRPITLHDMATGEERIFDVDDGWATLSPDGRRLATTTRVLDVETGEQIAGPFEPGRALWPLGRRDSRYLLRCGWNQEDLTVLDLDEGRELAVGGRQAEVLPDGGIVVLRDDRRAIDLLDAAGRSLRRLYPPR